MKVKTLNKKGIFFTFISVILMAALVIIFNPGESANIGSDEPVVKTRVQRVNEFVLALENSYFENILKVSSHRAILALISYINEEQLLFEDFPELHERFIEAIFQGRVNGQKMSVMEGNTMNIWLERMTNISRDTFNVNSQFTINEVNISQLRPWFVDLTMNISFSVTTETATWNVFDFIVNTELSIEGFNDTYYLVNTGGTYINQINKTNTPFDEWSVDNVNGHIRNATYVHFENSEAPSFLQRFTNDFSDTSQKECCGIESLVDPNKVSDKYSSYVDYMFAWDTTPECSSADPSIFTITGISDADYSGFKLDFDHVVLYNLLSEAQQICPPP